MEFGYWDENYKLWPMFRENNITNEWEANIYFNFDQIVTINGNTWISPSFADTVIEERETTLVILNEDGLYAEVPKDGHDTIPHYLKATVATSKDWEKVKEERFRRDDPSRRIDVETLREVHPSNRDYPLGCTAAQ
jgi:uroporphyrinogen decarboxylase